MATLASFPQDLSAPRSPSLPSSSPLPPLLSRSFMNINSDHKAPRSASTTPPHSGHTLLDPPEGVSFAEFLRTWSSTHVFQWLADLKCSAHADAFRVHEILGDLLLELDQQALKEMSITSIGDRIRILNGVRLLRQRCASRTATPGSPLRPSDPHRTPNITIAESEGARSHPRKEHGRPPPLQLQPNANKGDLPDIIRESAPDSATIRHSSLYPPSRPLPLPQQASSNGNVSTPGSSARSALPTLPPPPRGQPPPPPSTHIARPAAATPRSRASDTPIYITQPLPPTPHNQSHLATPSGSWIPSLSSSGSKVPARSTSPLPRTPRPRGPAIKKAVTSPNNTSKMGATKLGNHPYGSAQSTLHPPPNQGQNLSPIEEAFASHQASTTGTPSPPAQGYGRGPYLPPSLDDIKKKIVKFGIPDEDKSFTIDVTNCSSGQEVIEKVLKKIGKTAQRARDPDWDRDDNFNVDGWAVYIGDEGIGEPLRETQLLEICNAPDHPARQYGLFVRKLPTHRSPSPLLHAKQTNKSRNRASAVSILSGLGVTNPENALSEPTSPTSSVPFPHAKRPSKLRHFFGQRPPSELITDHLPEYFPTAEKKVLRTARHSMLMRHGNKRFSVASSIQQPPPSRFSTSTQGSQSRTSISPSRASFTSLPPLPDRSDKDGSKAGDASEDEQHSADYLSPGSSGSASSRTLRLLPPIPTGNFSDSVQELTGTRPLSHVSTNRMSYLSELRSNRDRSDTASMMTVDEITAEVESRRVSKVPDIANPDLDDWTKVDNDGETLKDPDAEGDTLVDEDGEQAEDEDDDELEDEDSDDDFDIAIPARTGANKWIKGALIGAGSFGKVYLGMDANNGLLMAVKQVELPVGSGPNQERKKSMLSALETEIELLKNLQHEHIVQYLYSSIDEEHLNIFLEYVPGGSVATLLSNYGAFEEQLVRTFVHQILQGLHYLHERDIIHRDIKGANILVDNKGGVKISDFGISKKVDDNLLGGNRLHRASLQGSVFWMAPEVVKQTGHTKKADIWSVGCLVVEMLTGEHPWAQLTQMQAIFKIGSSAKPAIPTDISQEAQDFLKCTFEINHEARPASHELLQFPWIAKKSRKGSALSKAEAKAERENSKDSSPGLEPSPS